MKKGPEWSAASPKLQIWPIWRELRPNFTERRGFSRRDCVFQTKRVCQRHPPGYRQGARARQKGVWPNVGAQWQEPLSVVYKVLQSSWRVSWRVTKEGSDRMREHDDRRDVGPQGMGVTSETVG
eukprot:5420546-Pyramimonas_sp.AAC.1